ncbi:MAG: response regulator, partial [Bryobacterales bacterium]|nr:response regulator [Bryobacterales bacterium]
LGCTVAVVEDGAEAVGAFSREAYDLIFMDCHMPGMDGFAATRAIRSMGPAGRDIPIVALTADVLSDGAQRCAEAGMTEFLAKPVDLRRLGAVLKRYVRHRATEPPSQALISESQP